jgi:hypothetical protein
MRLNSPVWNPWRERTPATVILKNLQPYTSDGSSYEGYSTVVVQSSLDNYDFTSGTIP